MGFMMSRLPGNFIEMPSCPGSNYNIDVTDHLLAQKEGAGKRLLLMGHLDTVFPLNNSFQEFYCEGDMMYGPGVADMQGGLVVLLYTLKALAQAGELDDKTLAILLNSDEEIGSLSSRKYLEEQALIHDYGLVHESGVTVNVGVISGGEARNTIAPYAEAMVDLRYPQPQHGEDAVAQFKKIFGSVMSYPIDSGEISAESWINLHRPPKVPTAESEHLLEKTLAIGRLLGQELGVVNSGGGTDGSLTQAMGLPTLDSLGVAGTGAHSNQEKARVSSLVERAKLSAVLIRRLAAE